MKKTKLQQKKTLARTRNDARVRKIRKYRPLIITQGLIEYAFKHGWDDATVDAAALVMDFYFRHIDDLHYRGWLPMPYQTFKGLFGKDYKRIRNHMIEVGFLEYNEHRGHRAGSHCSVYRLCTELRYSRVEANYRLKSKALQELYIANKEHWKCLTAKKREELAAVEVEAAFATDTTRSYNKLVEQGHLTSEQLDAIKRLAGNAHKLKLRIDDNTVSRIATERYEHKTYKEKANYDLDAYTMRLLGKADSTLEPKVSVCDNGRFYTPFTNVPREFWDYTTYRGKPLAGVDVKNSHVNCLLMLLKDLSINFFGAGGSYQERLENCQFAKQIEMIPNLKHHLQTTSLFYQESNCNHYYFTDVLSNTTNRLPLNHQFIKQYYKTVKDIYRSHLNPFYTKLNHIDFTNYLHTSYHIPLPTNNDISTSNNPLSNPIPITLYASKQNVGVALQVELFQQVMKIFHACRFAIKSADEVNHGQSGGPQFRDLFFSSVEEIAKLERLLDQDFYTLLMGSIGTDMRRDDFKGEFFHFLYRPAFHRFDKIRHMEGGNLLYTDKVEEPVRKAFEKLLPSITFFLDLCKCKPGTLERKGNDYKWISRAMISIESQVILETCANLWKKYPKMFLATVHDCIKCLPKDVKKVEAELKRTFKKYHISPKFETKLHEKPSD